MRQILLRNEYYRSLIDGSIKIRKDTCIILIYSRNCKLVKVENELQIGKKNDN